MSETKEKAIKAKETKAPDVELDTIPQFVWITPTTPTEGLADRQVNIGTAYRLMEKKKTWKPKTKADSDAIKRYGSADATQRAAAETGYCGCDQA